MVAEEIGSFVLVLVVAVCVAGAISALYATGLRLWGAGGGEAGANRPVAIACFAGCVVIVLFALWLMIPAFH
ncbi:MAG: hypothetical protein KHY83_00790 [Coriobacteriia bacterium]|nr:hypothetical protein [Coriobacteriia bacterium]MBS5477191.1 hypothetical protein [Coriobacteriia bacterium]